MNRIIKSSILFFALMVPMGISGCSDEPEPTQQYTPPPPPAQYAQPIQPQQYTPAPAVPAPAPIIVQQQPAPSSTFSDVLTGVAVGHMIGNMFNGSSNNYSAPPPRQNVTINKTYIAPAPTTIRQSLSANAIAASRPAPITRSYAPRPSSPIRTYSRSFSRR